MLDLTSNISIKHNGIHKIQIRQEFCAHVVAVSFHLLRGAGSIPIAHILLVHRSVWEDTTRTSTLVLASLSYFPIDASTFAWDFVSFEVVGSMDLQCWMCMCVYIHIHTHTHIYKHTHIYIYIYMQNVKC